MFNRRNVRRNTVCLLITGMRDLSKSRTAKSNHILILSKWNQISIALNLLTVKSNRNVSQIAIYVSFYDTRSNVSSCPYICPHKNDLPSHKNVSGNVPAGFCVQCLSSALVASVRCCLSGGLSVSVGQWPIDVDSARGAAINANER